MSPTQFFENFRKRFAGEPTLRPQERRAARYWVRVRLQRLFPELKDDPDALDALYETLDLEPRPGLGKGGAVMYEIVLPEKYARRL
jgi:hypothetical protein